jgi:ATP-dependent Lhr-like helicase
LGWPAIRRGEHTLILAPTGSGKTLAAFLCAIDQLYRDLAAGVRPKGVRLLYVSPLKALNNDVERNLRVPLAGIQAAAARAQTVLPDVRVAVRTGDTSAAARRQMLKQPPHILITTPESLYLLLTSPLAREMFRTVRTVIVDEIHTLCGEKRGVHLSLSLERLGHLAAEPVQRIGLSATVRPLDEAARFLGGQAHSTAGTLTPRPVTIVDAGYRKPLDLQVITAVEDFGAMPGGSVWPSVVPRVLQDIMAHRSTLIFANSRRMAERTADRLNVQLEAEQSEEIEPGSTEALAPGGGSSQDLRATVPSARGRGPGGGSSQDLRATVPSARGRGPGGVPRDGGMFTLGANGPIRAHHGSMSKEARRAMEEDLKEGILPALVGTSSLELGIDIGAIDLVVQVQSPKSVAQGLQRVGRSGHLVGQTSVGHIYAIFREDLIEAAALARGMLEGDVELTSTPRNPLDVLAQQIVAMVSVEDWSTASLYDLARGAYAYRDLARPSFDLVLEMLAGRFRAVGSNLRARIAWDRVNDRLSALPGSRLLALSNGGTITDRGAYGVYLGDGKTRIGELDEEFVFETKVGNTFLLGSQTWRVLDIQNDRVLVGAAAGSMVRMPFWRGDYPWRTYELGLRIGRFRRELSDRIRSSGEDDEAIADWLRQDFHLDDRSVRNLIAYVRTQLSASGVISSDRQIVVESCEDALGARLWVIHSPFGGRINGAWALVIGSALREQSGIDIETQTNDDGMLFRFPQREREPHVGLLRMSPREARERIMRALPDSAVFGAHFRMNASRALLLPAARGGKRTPFWLQRLKAKDLLALVRKFDDFPIVVETYRECLRDVLDLPHLEELLTNIESGRIELVPIESFTPSPIAASLLAQFEAIYQYEWDAPKAERALHALTLRQDVLEELLAEGGPGLRELLKPTAIAELGRQAQHLEPGFRARAPDELAQHLYELGDLTTGEVALRCAQPARDWLTALATDGRAVEMVLPTQHGPERRWVHAELSAQYRDAFSGNGDAARSVLRRFLRNSGPVTLDALRARYAFAAEWLESSLAQMIEAREVARGRFTAGLESEEYCDRANLERIHRRTLTILRREVQPVSPAAYADFVLRWQHVHPASHAGGPDGLLRVVQQLRGAVVPGAVWERDVLPQRLNPYLPSDLDRLGQDGGVNWVADGKEPRRARVRFVLRGEGGLFLAEPAPLTDLSEPARAVHEYLRTEGASFSADVEAGIGHGARAVREALVELALTGRATNDTLNTLRALLAHDSIVTPGRLNPLEAELGSRMHQSPRVTSVRYRAAKRRVQDRLQQEPPGVHWAGRWSLVHRAAVLGTWPNGEDRAAFLAQLLLDRYGVLARECLQLEELPVDWAALYPQLERKEMRGEVRRGYFVAGLSGAQFALPDALEKLRTAANGTDDAFIVMNACDPANVLSLDFSMGSPDGWPPMRFARTPSTHVVVNRGQPLLVAADTGSRISTAADAAPEYLERALQTYLSRPNAPRHVSVSTWNGREVLGSPAEALLRTAGFTAAPRGMEKWGT